MTVFSLACIGLANSSLPFTLDIVSESLYDHFSNTTKYTHSWLVLQYAKSSSPKSLVTTKFNKVKHLLFFNVALL